jgi:hypothetical protein
MNLMGKTMSATSLLYVYRKKNLRKMNAPSAANFASGYVSCLYMPYSECTSCTKQENVHFVGNVSTYLAEHSM